MSVRVARRRYEEIVRGFSRAHVLVVGDVMIDEYLMGSARRISPEGPVMIVDVHTDDFKPGGAANVVNNLLALGSRVSVAGAIGDDEMGKRLRSDLASHGAAVDGLIVDPARPTTRKTRIVAQRQQVLRVDREHTVPIGEAIVSQLLRFSGACLPQADAALISDYRKGVVTRDVALGVCAQAKGANKRVIGNPKPASAAWLAGADVLSLNQVEAEELAREPIPEEPTALREFGATLRMALDVDTLVVTRGSRGLAYWRSTGEHRVVAAHPVEVYDVAGAGDTTISAMTLALVSGATHLEAAFIANHAGACVVRKSGVATTTPDELIEDWQP
ncbi:MAG: D-glycero-beta-D-manno-heptose-7-phosphate kinase [Armatimonadetes bacterium]|nr:D-glycero-beta-D-manno-heptose-7-phosphate kinase [Armatimonadota bacterium]MDE2207337.1 D-glycero-beta-D-manno-heptose-7-phosphate kinase [Armatimonadota bacterium]